MSQLDDNKNPGPISAADYLIFMAAGFSIFLSVYLWFGGSKDQGVFVGLWVPSILAVGIYFRLILRSKVT